MMRRLSDLRAEHGQTTVLAACLLTTLLAFLALAIDVGNLRYNKRKLQSAADAAAMAAALEIHYCGGQSGCVAMTNAATSALAENGYTNVSVNANCAGAVAGSAFTLTINTPPCALGASDPNNGKTTAVEVQLSESQSTVFAGLIGWATVPMSARAEAARPLSPSCIYALDPSNAGAISVTLALGISSKCGVVDESSSSSAFSCLVGLGISAPTISIHGAASGLLCAASGEVISHAAVPTPADPLAYLPKPTVGACGYQSGNNFYGSSSAVNILLGGTYVFHPGVYCGGISMTAALAADITFEPGTYILKTGPGLLGLPQGGLNLTIGLLSNIHGSGVTFYNTGTVGSISITAPSTLMLSNFNLTAPTSGTYGGVLFFQDPSDTATGTFLISLASGGKLDGAIYLPSATVSYGVGAISSDYTILVAKDINFNVAVLSQFGNDYSSLAAGSPINGNLAVLSQ